MKSDARFASSLLNPAAKEIFVCSFEAMAENKSRKRNVILAKGGKVIMLKKAQQTNKKNQAIKLRRNYSAFYSEKITIYRSTKAGIFFFFKKYRTIVFRRPLFKV